MATSYSQIIDPQVIEQIIADDYLNEARLINSSIMRMEGAPNEGSQLAWIKQTLFEGDDEGQAVGVDTEISLQSEVQTEYQVPIVQRADGAEFDDIVEMITPKKKAEIETKVTNAISKKAAQMTDSVGIKIIDGCAQFIVTDGTNYNNANGSQVNLVDLEETKSKRGEKGTSFNGGHMIMRGLMYHKLAAIGQVASTSNTMGNMKQDEIVRGGLKGTLLDMNLFSTDKIALESGGDHFIHFVEQGALRMLVAEKLSIDPFIRSKRAFKDSTKFMVRLGGIIDGLSWASAKANIVSNTDLATGSNYELAKTNIKNVPLAVARFDAPTF